MTTYETIPEEPLAAQAPKKTTTRRVVVAICGVLGMAGAAVKLSGGAATFVPTSFMDMPVPLDELFKKSPAAEPVTLPVPSDSPPKKQVLCPRGSTTCEGGPPYKCCFTADPW